MRAASKAAALAVLLGVLPSCATVADYECRLLSAADCATAKRALGAATALAAEQAARDTVTRLWVAGADDSAVQLRSGGDKLYIEISKPF